MRGMRFKLMAAALAYLIFATTTFADCRRVSFSRVVHHQPVKAVAFVEKIVTPVVAVFPLYSAIHFPGYYPGGSPVVPPPVGVGVGANSEVVPGWAKEMLSAVRVLTDGQVQQSERIRRIEDHLGLQAPAPPLRRPGPMPRANGEAGDPGPAPAPLKAAGRFFEARCAACHETAKAASMGGGFVMFQGQELAQIKPDQVSEIIRRVLLPANHKDRMPRGGKAWTAAEKGDFLERLGAALGIGEEGQPPEPKDRK